MPSLTIHQTCDIVTQHCHVIYVTVWPCESVTIDSETVWQYDSETDWQCDCNRVIDRSTARAAVLSCIDAAGGAPRWVMNMSTCSPSPGQSSLSTSCLESSLSSSSSSSSSWALLPLHHAAGKEKRKNSYLDIDSKIWHYFLVSKKTAYDEINWQR